jgi:hypothetical protein
MSHHFGTAIMTHGAREQIVILDRGAVQRGDAR